MLTINLQEFDVGSVIKFSTKNPNDSRVWKGTVIGIGNYQFASGITDLITYYEEILSSLGTTETISKLNTATFIVIKKETNTGIVTDAVAVDWIVPSSFSVVASTASYTIQVYTHTGETVDTVLSILRDNGFVCKSLS